MKENRGYHRGVKRSPFEAIFGKKIMLANEDGNIPFEEERALAVNENERYEGLNRPKILDWSKAVKEAPQADPNYYASSKEENVDHNNNNEGVKNANDTELTASEQLKQDIEVQQAGVRIHRRNRLRECYRS